MKRKTLYLFIVICVLLIGFFIGKETSKPNQPEAKFLEKKETREVGYEFINPLLECENVDQLGNPSINNIEKITKSYIENKTECEVSLYFRDLKNGPWFGISLDLPFAPQSLLKLPVMFAYYKMAEENPQILDEKIDYKNQVFDEEGMPEQTDITPGQAYTIEHLINRMIVYSDNAAFELLTTSLPENRLIKIHMDLGIPYPKSDSVPDFMTAKDYASLFRVLYNSSYLTRYYSNLALTKLIDAKYKNALVKGVLNNIKVAHKFGIKAIKEDQKDIQLHDCGIIYHPKNPYLLCIMTKGNDLKILENTIAQISKIIFQEIDKL